MPLERLGIQIPAFVMESCHSVWAWAQLAAWRYSFGPELNVSPASHKRRMELPPEEEMEGDWRARSSQSGIRSPAGTDDSRLGSRIGIEACAFLGHLTGNK